MHFLGVFLIFVLQLRLIYKFILLFSHLSVSDFSMYHKIYQAILWVRKLSVEDNSQKDGFRAQN